MDIRKQEILSIRHYFQSKPLSCIVVSGDTDSFFTAKTLEPLRISRNITKGDPIIIGALQDNNEVEITGGKVVAVNETDGHITVSPDKIYDSIERRKFERYPVSLTGDVRYLESSDKRVHVYIKDMSYGGFCFSTEAELTPGENIETDIFLRTSVFSISGMVMRKSVSYGRNEYGIQIVYKDKNSMYAIREFLDKLLSSEKELIKKHLLRDFRIAT